MLTRLESSHLPPLVSFLFYFYHPFLSCCTISIQFFFLFSYPFLLHFPFHFQISNLSFPYTLFTPSYRSYTLFHSVFPFLSFPFLPLAPFPICLFLSHSVFPSLPFPWHILFFSQTPSKAFYTIFWFSSENQRLLMHDGSHFHVYVSMYQIERQLSIIGVITQQKSNVPQE